MMIIASAYLYQNSTENPTIELKRLIDYSNTRRLLLVIGCDATPSTRYEELLEYLV